MYYSCNPKTSSSFSTFCIVQCAICKEVLLADDLIARPNNCLHMCHFICIDEWLKVGFIVCYLFSSDHEEIVRSILLERCLKLQPVAKMLRHSHGKTTFLASNRSWPQVCKIKYWPPSSLPFKVVPPSFEYGLVLLATLIRGGGGITSTRSWTGYLCQNTVVSQVRLQLVVSLKVYFNKQFPRLKFSKRGL